MNLVQIDDNTWVDPEQVASVEARLNTSGERTRYHAPTRIGLKSGAATNVSTSPEDVIAKLTEAETLRRGTPPGGWPDDRLVPGWRCALHGAIGRDDDGSLRQHEREHHDGATICVQHIKVIG